MRPRRRLAATESTNCASVMMTKAVKTIVKSPNNSVSPKRCRPRKLIFSPTDNEADAHLVTVGALIVSSKRNLIVKSSPNYFFIVDANLLRIESAVAQKICSLSFDNPDVLKTKLDDLLQNVPMSSCLQQLSEFLGRDPVAVYLMIKMYQEEERLRADCSENSVDAKQIR